MLHTVLATVEKVSRFRPLDAVVETIANRVMPHATVKACHADTQKCGQVCQTGAQPCANRCSWLGTRYFQYPIRIYYRVGDSCDNYCTQCGYEECEVASGGC